MENTDRKIAAKAEGQHSLITMTQLAALGLKRYEIEYRVRIRRLHTVHRGVYRLAGVRPYFEQNVLAACLATGGLASHRTAAALFNLRGINRDQIEISVNGPAARKLDGVRAYRIRALEATTVGGIPVTMPMQTLLHLASVEPRLAEGALADAVARRLVRVPALVRYLDEVGRNGRNGTVTLRRLTEPYVTGVQPTESWLEDRLVEFLRTWGFPEPERQYQVLLPGRSHPIRLDCAYPTRALDLEADSSLWHTGPRQRQADAERDEAVRLLGWHVLRVTWLDLKENPTALAAKIAHHLGRKRAA